MEQSLKEKLERCQILLEEGKYDELLDTLEQVRSVDFSGLDRDSAQELISLLNFLIEKAQKRRDEIAGKLVNMNKFKGYLRSG